jgi:hypothetical protein
MRDEKKEKLRAYSEQARKAIIERFPELAEGWKEQADGSLFFEMKSPSGGNFWIETRGFEVIVGFEFPHEHFGTYDSDFEQAPLEAVLEAEGLIRDLLAGKYKAATWTRKGKYVQSMLIEAEIDPATIPMSWLGRWWTKGCTIEERRWH